MKLYYFDLYGIGEPIRMLLTYCKVQFEDIRLDGDKMVKLKSEGLFEFGQTPMLELDDGTRLVQTSAILSYLGSQYGMVPDDAMMRYWGECTVQHKLDMIRPLFACISEADEHLQKKKTEDFATGGLVMYLAQLDKRLVKGKFICGDKLTWYDFMIFPLWTDLMENPHCNKIDMVKEKMEELCSDKVKQYVADCKAEMADYLQNRPESTRGF